MQSKSFSFYIMGLGLTLGLQACADDPAASPPGVGASSGTGGSDGDGGSGGAGGDGARACDDLELSSALVDAGTWDPNLYVAGFGGPDGLVPSVYDFARDADGTLLAVGRFRYIGTETVRPLARLEGGTWQGDSRLPVDVKHSGLSAIATDEMGHIAVATYSTLPFSLGERLGEI